MKSTIFFIDTEYGNHLIASRPIKQYSIDNIVNSLITRVIGLDTLVFIKSNLIGLTDKIIDEFINQRVEQEILVGTLDSEPCIIRIDGKSLSTFVPNDLSFDNLVKDRSSYALPQNSLKLLNNTTKLVVFEKAIQNQLRRNAIEQGVFLQDPDTTYLSFDTKFGHNVSIEPNVYFGSNVNIQDNVTIKAFSYLEGAEIGNGAIIGPFARIRKDSKIGNDVKVGNFVEIKNSTLDTATKANHLSYIGDATIGKNVNIGAGVVTCNYNGVKKYQTIIGDDTFIGSNSSLIAPIIIGSNALIGASSFVNMDVPNNTFASGRGKQEMKPNRRK